MKNDRIEAESARDRAPWSGGLHCLADAYYRYSAVFFSLRLWFFVFHFIIWGFREASIAWNQLLVPVATTEGMRFGRQDFEVLPVLLRARSNVWVELSLLREFVVIFQVDTC